MPRISFYPDDDLYRLIVAAADRDGRTVSNFMVNLVSAGLRGRVTPHPVAARGALAPEPVVDGRPLAWDEELARMKKP